MQGNYKISRKSMNYKSNETVIKQNGDIFNKCEYIKMYDPHFWKTTIKKHEKIRHVLGEKKFVSCSTKIVFLSNIVRISLYEGAWVA